jgi:hypothetical protein
MHARFCHVLMLGGMHLLFLEKSGNVLSVKCSS